MISVYPQSLTVIDVGYNEDEPRGIHTEGQQQRAQYRANHPSDNDNWKKATSWNTFSLKLFGLYFLPDKPKSGWCSESNDRRCRPKFFRNAWQVYSFVVLVVLWLNFVRSLTFFAGGKNDIGGDLFNKVGMTAFSAMCAVQSAVFFRACQTDLFRRLLCDLCRKEDFFEYARRHSLFFAVAAWVMVFYQLSSDIYFILFTDGSFDQIIFAPVANLLSSPTIRVAGRSLYMILDLYTIVTWCHTVAINCLIAGLLRRQFVDVNVRIGNAIDDRRFGQVDFEEIFDRLRREHQEVCRRVEKADEIMSIGNAAVIMSALVNCVFVLYSIIYFTNGDVVIIVQYVFSWFGSFLLQLAVTAGCGVVVNNAVRSNTASFF